MSYRVFIDGSEGTTGLKLVEQLSRRKDLELLTIEEELRKDLGRRLELLEQADITFLCLPDQASRELVQAADGIGRILDASTAHRTHPDWVYGMPELCAEQRQKIETTARLAIPGCHATGFLLLARPLVELGIAGPDYPFTCHSITGYSGGGKSMIAAYEADNRPSELKSPRQYGLSLHHKHLTEMRTWALLAHEPVFHPIVADFYRGMLVTLPLHARSLAHRMNARDLHQVMIERYQNQPLIQVMDYEEEPRDGFLAANGMSGSNRLQIFVTGHQDQIALMARFDNLGKGASGAGIQCMNLMLGLPEETGL